MAGGTGRRSAAGHADNAGTKTSGAGGLYPALFLGIQRLPEWRRSWPHPAPPAVRCSRPSRDHSRRPMRRGLAGSHTQTAPVPVVNQIRTYWWCSPPRTGRQRMRPARSTGRETGASFSKDRCVRTRDGGAALRTQQRGQGIPVGSNRFARCEKCAHIQISYNSCLMGKFRNG